MNVLLIGCGRTGRAISEYLVELKFVKNLFLYSRTAKSSKSLAYDLGSKKVSVVSKIKDLRNIDYIIITLSSMSDSAREESFFRRKNTYEVRQDELKFNIGAIASLIDDLKTFPQKTKIIVVTNPVDEITNYLRIVLGKENILGFGLELDAKRYEKRLGKNVFCIGMHGKAIPLIDLKNEKEYESLSKKTDKSLLEFVRASGIPHNVAGKTFQEFFKKLNSNHKEIIHTSFYIKDKVMGVEDISISLPCEVSHGKILGVAKINVNNVEQSLFVKSVAELKKSVNHILKAHKQLIEYK